MAQCRFSSFIIKKEKGQSPCGTSTDYPDQVHTVSLGDCQKDISRHLEVFGISEDPYLNSEMNLILIRAGNSLVQLA